MDSLFKLTMSFLSARYVSFSISLILLLTGNSFVYSQFSTTESASPCQTYLTISIGQIDPQFELTSEEVSRIASEAMREWEIEVRKNSAAYIEEMITINFIHNLNSKVGKEDFEWRNKIEHIRSNIQKNRLAYITNLQNLNKKWEVFEEEINSYDLQRKGWQRKFDKEKLEALEQLQERLMEKERNLELKRRSVESEYVALNRMRDSRDSLINEYKQRFDLQKDITLGVYERNGTSQTIDIYYFNNPEQLKSILLHEFGHAYGIKHIEGSNSIMRHKIEANGKIKAKLSNTDIEALKNICSTDYPDE